MATIDLMYGKQTFRNASSTINIFSYQDGTRVYPGKVMEKSRQGSRNAASYDGDTDNGVWYLNHYESKDGVILGVHLNSTFNKGIHTDCMFLIRLREEAPLIQVNANVCKNADAIYDSVPVFTGRADVITPVEAVKYGVVFSDYVYRRMFDKEEIEEEFQVNTIKAGTPKPKMTKVKTPDGGTRHVAISPEAKRRVRVRRK